MERILVVVCARGGSSLPKKNLAEISGVPLLSITKESVKLPPDRYVVVFSTDDHEIARYAKEHGFWIPSLRPAEYASDNSPIDDTLIYTTKLMEKQYRLIFSYVVCIQNSSLFRVPSDIIKCVDYLSSSPNGINGAMCVHRAEHEHPDKVYTLSEHGLIQYQPHDLNKFSPYRRQDLRPVFYHNGLCYAVRKEYLLEHKRLIPHGLNGYVETERWRAMDIHTDHDIRIASALYPVFQEWRQKIGKDFTV